MPPEALKPTLARRECAAMAASMAFAAAGVAETGVLPVLVLMKSTPSSSAITLALLINAASRSSPDSRISLSVSAGWARRTAATNAEQAARWPAAQARQGSTRSISSPPAAAMAALSASASSRSSAPCGKLATAATRTAGSSAPRARATKRGQTQTAATLP